MLTALQKLAFQNGFRKLKISSTQTAQPFWIGEGFQESMPNHYYSEKDKKILEDEGTIMEKQIKEEDGFTFEETRFEENLWNVQTFEDRRIINKLRKIEGFETKMNECIKNPKKINTYMLGLVAHPPATLPAPEIHSPPHQTSNDPRLVSPLQAQSKLPPISQPTNLQMDLANGSIPTFLREALSCLVSPVGFIDN